MNAACAGFFGIEFFEPVKRLDRRSLDLSEREYVDALMELDY